jgi:uncharacterized protein YidB (DUF937 family)
MGLLDDVENKALASMLGSSSSPLATGLLQMLNNQPGGLAGLIQSFHDKGMGGLVQSWVSTGQNLPITADQISHVLGSDQVKQIAAAAGISPDAAGSTLAKLLPALIDHATPNGQLPQQGNLMDIGKSLLQSLSSQTHA